jgi:hypothetical protein
MQAKHSPQGSTDNFGINERRAAGRPPIRTDMYKKCGMESKGCIEPACLTARERLNGVAGRAAGARGAIAPGASCDASRITGTSARAHRATDLIDERVAPTSRLKFFRAHSCRAQRYERQETRATKRRAAWFCALCHASERMRQAPSSPKKT